MRRSRCGAHVASRSTLNLRARASLQTRRAPPTVAPAPRSPLCQAQAEAHIAKGVEQLQEKVEVANILTAEEGMDSTQDLSFDFKLEACEDSDGNDGLS